LDVISDNLANTSTVGYKSASTEFSDLFNKVISSNSKTPTTDDIGLGAQLQATSFQFQQGTLMPSDRFSDLAIEGNGWFGVTSKDQNYFTRDGQFSFDTYQQVNGDVNSSSARLVTGDGMYVAGTMLSNFAYNPSFDYGDLSPNDVSGAYVLNSPASDVPLASADAQTKLDFPTRLAYPVEPTTQIKFYGNLGIDNVSRSISGDAISGNNAINRINLTFTQSAQQPTDGIAWDIVATATTPDGSTVYDTQLGQAVFDRTGQLSRVDIGSLDNDGTPVAIDLGSNFGGVISLDGLAITGSSQSNGISGGTLTKYGINADGIIIADFSNGHQSAIGRVAVYHFQNDQGLNREGGTYFTESSDSGNPLIWTDASGNGITGATVRSGSLETSNARIEVGLTDMIVMQRAYQANAKTITTVDEMLQKALQMHR
jgi:flagellar hook protein FlgE